MRIIDIIKGLVVCGLFIPLFQNPLYAQGIAINDDGTAPSASAILDLKSTTQGLLMPRMTTVQRTNISNPATGLTVFDVTIGDFYFYNGSVWKRLGATTMSEIATNDGNESVKAFNDSVVIATDGTDRIFVSKNGNVGIGAPSDDAKLQVNGTITSTDGNLNLLGLGTPTALWGGRIFLSDGSVNGIEDSKYWIVQNYGDDLHLGRNWNSPSYTPKMALTKGGNVGIGTDAPSNLLDVNGNATVRSGSLHLWSHDAYKGGRIYLAKPGENSNADTNHYSIYTSNWGFFVGDEDGQLMRIYNNSHVGIGDISNAGQKLDVDGNVRLRGGSVMVWARDDNNGGLLRLADKAKYTEWSNSWDILNTGDDLAFRDDGTDRFFLSSDGNVGIGNINPGHALDVSGNARLREGELYIWSQDANNGGKIVLADKNVEADASSYWQIFNSGDDLSFRDETTERLHLANNGNMGVGVSNPGQRIDTDGDMRIRGGDLYLWSRNTTSGGRILLADQNVNADATNYWQISNSGDDLSFMDQTTERMHLSSNGNVGIGTSAPSQKLHVSGDAYVTGRLGIGTSSPTNGILEISGHTTKSHSDFRYLDGITGNGWDDYESNSTNVGTSIYTSGAVSGSRICVRSDTRIKTIDSISSRENDLNILMQVEITDYHYKDPVNYGTAPQKKVIAQQVKEVFPQAVTAESVEVIPDIYQMANISEGWVALPTDLAVNDKVQLIGDAGPELLIVLEVSDEGFRVASELEGEVFVYGRQVDDLHQVDYDALAMLNISATQALYDQMKQLKAENEALKASFENLDAKVDALINSQGQWATK